MPTQRCSGVASLGSVSRIASIYVGSVVGAGFASGREIWSFFARFGLFGFIGIVAASALLCVLAPLLMRTMRSQGFRQYGELYSHYLSGKAAVTIDFVTTIYLFGVLSVMFTGAVSLVNDLSGLGHLRSAAITAILLTAVTSHGPDRIATVSSYLSPALIVGVSLLCLERVYIGHLTIDGLWPQSSTYSVLLDSIASSVVYVSYNMLMCLGVFTSLASSGHRAGDLVLGGVAGGAILGGMSSLVIVALTANPSHLGTTDMPLLSIAGQRGGFIYVAYTAAVWAAMITTALSMLLSLTSRLNALPSHRTPSFVRRKAGIWLVLLCIPISHIGFGPLMDRVYLVFGVIGLVVLVLVLRSLWRH